MQTLVPDGYDTVFADSNQGGGSEPQFVQIERLVRGLLLVDGKRTLEAIRRSLAERISIGSLNHFLAESPWLEADVHKQLWSVLASNPMSSPTAREVCSLPMTP